MFVSYWNQQKKNIFFLIKKMSDIKHVINKKIMHEIKKWKYTIKKEGIQLWHLSRSKERPQIRYRVMF